jgi:hypothetical protein
MTLAAPQRLSKPKVISLCIIHVFLYCVLTQLSRTGSRDMLSTDSREESEEVGRPPLDPDPGSVASASGTDYG